MYTLVWQTLMSVLKDQISVPLMLSVQTALAVMSVNVLSDIQETDLHVVIN